MIPPPFERALIIGASSGIGEELARQLAARNCRVALVARRAEELLRVASEINSTGQIGGSSRALTFEHDVMNYGECPALLQEICRELGGLDLFIYAAGVMPAVADTEYNFEKDRAMIEVNLLGAIAWTNEVARRFERLGSGTIVGISSVAGDRGRRSQPVYGTSKAALDAYLEAIRNRVSRFGVNVVTIKPGPVVTPMTRNLGKLPLQISAQQAASEIIAVLVRGDRLAYIPGVWRPIMGTLRSIPSFIFQKLNI